MRQFLLPALALTFCVTACNSDKNTSETETDKDTTKVEVKGIQSPADILAQKMEELKKMPALTIEELKSYLPDEINGVKRNNYSASSSMGYSFVQGQYKKNNRTQLQVMLYDCAGESGSAWYATTYSGQMNFQQETETEYTKTIDFMGNKAIENFKKNDNHTTLTFVANDRILVMITGMNMSPDEVKEAAQKLNFQK